MTAPHPTATLFPDLDLLSLDEKDTAEDWTPDHSDDQGLTFVPLFEQVPARPVSAAISTMATEAREEGFAAGMATGREAERASREMVVAESLSRIADGVADARWAATAVAEQTAAEMARLVSDVLALALPTLAARAGTQDAVAFVARLVPALIAEPQVDIRVAPSIVPDVSGQLAGQSTMHVKADAALPEGDVRITWRDGQAEHRVAAFRSALLGMIADLLGPTDHQPTTPTGTER